MISDKFIQTHVVQEQHIDPNKHLNNIVYVQWMQEIAIAHSDRCGWSTQKYHQNQCTWFAKSHFINYIFPGCLNDNINLETWVDNIKKCSSLRKYHFSNQHGKCIAQAETQWVFIDIITGRPKSIPQNIKQAFTKSSF